MMTKRTSITGVIAVMVLTVAACGGDAGPPDQIVITVPGVDVEITIPVEDVPIDGGVVAPITPGESTFQPAMPLPDGFPLYPGAEMWADIPYDPARYTYMLSSPGTSQEIVDFYAQAFRDMGLDVTEEFVMFEEFMVVGEHDGEMIATIGWLDDPDPDGPRGFMILIDHPAWADARVGG
jgi:hypothetical protein